MICPQMRFTGGNESYQSTVLCVTGGSQLMKAGQAGLEPAGGPGASILVQEAKASSLLLHKGDFSP